MRPYLLAGLVFISSVILTTPHFWADAADYVDSVTDFQKGKYYEFWEFGHLLWRPLGWLVWTTACDLSDPYYWRYQVFKIFQWFNLTAGLGSALLMAYILRQLNIRDLINVLTVGAFICSHAFLNFTQTGTSYVTGLFFLILAIALIISQEPRQPRLISALAGLSLALSAGFWIAYIWAIPAAVLTVPILYGFNRVNIIHSTVTFFSLILFSALMFGAAILALELSDLAAISNWVLAAAHGIDTSGMMRSLFGVARSFVVIETGGIQFKRFLIGDPYNPVSWGMLINLASVVFTAFWLTAATLVALGMKSVQVSKRWLLLLLSFVLPVFMFGILFDGGAVERYLPMFPAAFIFIAIVLNQTSSKLARITIVAGISLLIAINLISLSTYKINKQLHLIEPRLSLVDANISSNDIVFMLNWNDDLVNFYRSFPFNPNNLHGNRKYHVIATPGVKTSGRWQHEFAERTIRAWGNGQKVWISARAFAETPDEKWNWVEGDDPRLRWRDFHTFFKELETGEHIGKRDGFVHIPPSNRNIEYIARFIDDDITQ